MVKEEEQENNRAKGDKKAAEMDYELFLRDLEEDPELRGMVNLYKGITDLFRPQKDGC
jgi:nonsense-mediated mRNA decay protein 3